MFRISHIIGVHRQHDRRCLEEIRELFEAAFPDYAERPRVHRPQAQRAVRPGHPRHPTGGARRRATASSASRWPITSSRSTTPTSTSSSPRAERRGRGQGGALYEALREDMIARGARASSSRCRPTTRSRSPPRPSSAPTRRDSASTSVTAPGPVMNTLYDQPIRPGNPPEPRLLYDPLHSTDPLRGACAPRGDPADPHAPVQLRPRRPLREAGRSPRSATGP